MSDNGNNQLALPDSVVVLLVILGAAASVCLGYAVQRNFSKADYQDDNFNKKPVNQMDYMREVRSRNQMAAFADARPQRYPRPEKKTARRGEIIHGQQLEDLLEENSKR
ncbi:hypothetical protein H2202_004607 [Exophiala xenobiotica]|nr:hypothetical protein H2202_004607 [Exophiala xenobiotica]